MDPRIRSRVRRRRSRSGASSHRPTSMRMMGREQWIIDDGRGRHTCCFCRGEEDGRSSFFAADRSFFVVFLASFTIISLSSLPPGLAFQATSIFPPCSPPPCQRTRRHPIESTSSTSSSHSPMVSKFLHRRRKSVAARAAITVTSSTTVPLEEEAISSNNGSKESSSSASSSDQQSKINSDDMHQHDNIISTLNILKKKYGTNKDVESAIVRLGRVGRTDDALRLYDAIWTLEWTRQHYGINRYKTRQQQQQHHDDDDELQQLPSDLMHFISKSKLRPTTRLMNSAIDACSRSHPSARQSTAFDIFSTATNPINIDGTKKPGGALSPNVFTFGSLLACCARNGDVTTSLDLLHVLEKGEKYPDVALNEVIYSTVISACERAEVPNVERALKVLNRGISTLSSGMNNNDNNNNDGGNDGGKKQNRARTKGTMGVVGYNAAISTMARAAQWKMAVQLLGEMILHSSMTSSNDDEPMISRSNPSYTPLESIREGTLNGDTDNDDANDDTTNIPPPPLLHVINDNKNIPNNNDIIIVPKPDEVTFGTVMAACERACQWEELLQVAKAANEYGVGLDGMALTSALHSCQQLGLADEAIRYLELMKRLGDDSEEKEADSSENDNGAVVQYQKKTTGRRQRKGGVKRQPLRGPDGVAYRLAISACARSPGGHRWQDGIRLLNEMCDIAAATNSSSLAPDVVSYTAAIAGCSEAGEYTAAMQLISEMRRKGIRPNVVTFSAVINACASASAKLASRRRGEEDVMDYYTSDDDDDDDVEDVRMPMMRALRLLEAMKSPNSSVRPNIVTYNAAIRACAEGLNLNGAFDLLRQLKEDKLDPTIVTYGSLMTACERVGDIEAASKVFRMVKESQLQVNEIIYGAAISCCRKAGQPERALLLLRKMISEKLSPNTATFNTVIAALAAGEGVQQQQTNSKTTTTATNNNSSDLPLWEKALAVYKVMNSKHVPSGVVPNRQTYNILIRCLSANIQPDNAEWMISEMRNAGFVPDVDLYTTTVRSYERAGQPIKALALMESMREVGYDFYEIKVLDDAFKSGIQILNKVGKGISSSLSSAEVGDNRIRGDNVVPSSYSMSEEILDFDYDDDADTEEDN